MGVLHARDAKPANKGPELALQSQADGGIRTLDPRVRVGSGEETEASEGSSEGVNAMQIRLF
jgi:hypothetical protein